MHKYQNNYYCSQFEMNSAKKVENEGKATIFRSLAMEMKYYS